MKIQELRHGAVTVLKPEGPLLDADADQFKTGAMTALRGSMGRLVVDLSAVPFVDSKGLEVLLDVTDEMSQQGQSLKLFATNKTVREVLELTDLVSLFEHYEDVNSAVRSFL
jgi:anti-anti-sigma factor